MYQNFKDIFTKNLPWKAFSILVATLLWFIVMNINNPTEVKTFSINLNINNLEKIKNSNVFVLNMEEIQNTKVEIKLKATRPVLDELTKRIYKGEIKAYIETNLLSKYLELEEPLEISLPIKTNLHTVPYPNNNFDIVSFTPTNITVKLDNKITIPKKVYPKLIGQVKQGYFTSTPHLSSEYIQVTGAKSILKTVDSVILEIDINNKDSTFEQSIKPIAYSKDGEVIEDVTFNLNEIKVKVPINLEGQIKVNSPNLVGNLKEGFFIKNISISPKIIEVFGNNQTLKNTTSINLPEINISNLDKSKEFIFKIDDLINKYNFKLKNKNVSEIKVYIEIEKTINKKLQIPSSKLSILGINDKFIELPDFFEIELNGSDKNMAQLDLENIKYSIDINGLENGEHKLQINVSLPNGISLTSIPYINISIKDTENDINTQNNKIESTTQENTEISSIEMNSNLETTS